MNRRYIAFDVETPNYANDRISAIGITIIENGQIVDDYYSLVNPEVRFDPFNIQLTGITPKMVADQPTFPQLWEQIKTVMGSGLLIAHNAPFDMEGVRKLRKKVQENTARLLSTSDNPAAEAIFFNI